jgi:Avirulence protein.
MAQTLNYFIAGYALILGLLAAYCVYLFLKSRKIGRALASLKKTAFNRIWKKLNKWSICAFYHIDKWALSFIIMSD